MLISKLTKDAMCDILSWGDVVAKVKNLTGKKFGKLTVLGRLENTKNGKTKWLCLCECGKKTSVIGCQLTSGKTQSCGCKKFESHNKVHGMTKTDIHNKWLQIKQRCYDKNCKTYKMYGAKGIKMCDEWRIDFVSFMNWSYKNGYREGLSIDRIDNSKGYSPENCRWVEWIEQANNRTSNIRFTYNGETKNLKQWCIFFDKNYSLVYERIKKLGWRFEKAMFTPKAK